MSETKEEAVAGPKPVYKTIRYGDLILGEAPAPDARIRKSIEQHGMFDIVIVRPWRDKFRVIAGNRRCMSIRVIALDRDLIVNDQPVYCRVIDDPDLALAAMVATNNARRINALSDLTAMLAITTRAIKKGLNVEEIEQLILRELGLTTATQRKRLKLKDLAQEFKMAVMERRMPISAAEQIAGLDARRQKALLKLLESRGPLGRLTAKDVREQRVGQTHAAADRLPWEQIAEPEAQ